MGTKFMFTLPGIENTDQLLDLVSKITTALAGIAIAIKFLLEFWLRVKESRNNAELEKKKMLVEQDKTEQSKQDSEINAAHTLSEIFTSVLRPMEDRVKNLESEVKESRSQIVRLRDQVWELQGVIKQKDRYIADMEVKYEQQVCITRDQQAKIDSQDKKIADLEKKNSLQEIKINDLQSEVDILKRKG